jgi:hypothetical protein
MSALTAPYRLETETAASKDACPICNTLLLAGVRLGFLFGLVVVRQGVNKWFPYLGGQLLRGKRVSLVCPKTCIVPDSPTTVGDDTIALLETGDVRADFDDRARE